MSTPAELAMLTPAYLAESNHSERLMGTSIAFIVISTVVYISFISSRVLFAERNGWETWVLYPLSYVCIIGLCAIGICLVQFGGAGTHAAYFLINDPTVITRYLQLQTATEFVYMAAVTVPKVALLLLYLRIFADRRVRIVTWTVVGVVITHFWTSGVIVGLTICHPFQYKWDKSISDGYCGDLMAAYRYISIPNFVTDLMIIFLPISTLWNLQMGKSRKIGIVLTFLTGSLGIITAIIRFVGFYTLDLASDPTFLCVETMLYSIVEPGSYFICSCLPGMRPLVRAIYEKSGLGSRFTASGQSTAPRFGSTDIALGHLKGTHSSMVSAARRKNYNDDGDRIGFIQLEETVEVTSKPYPM